MFGLLREMFRAFNEDKVPQLASSIAFATIFALAPLLIIVIAIAGFIVGVENGGHGHHVAESALMDQIRSHAGAQAANAVHGMIDAAFNKPRASIVAQTLGWTMFVIGASGLFGSLQDALNTIWRVETMKHGWKQMVRDRFATLAMIVLIGFMLLLTLAANAALAFISKQYFTSIPSMRVPLISVLATIVNIAFATLGFAVLYKILPNIGMRWQDAWRGAFATAILFVAGEALIALYISTAGIASAYGASGAILVALIWIYYSAMIFLIGAEYTKVSTPR